MDCSGKRWDHIFKICRTLRLAKLSKTSKNQLSMFLLLLLEHCVWANWYSIRILAQFWLNVKQIPLTYMWSFKTKQVRNNKFWWSSFRVRVKRPKPNESLCLMRKDRNNSTSQPELEILFWKTRNHSVLQMYPWGLCMRLVTFKVS